MLFFSLFFEVSACHLRTPRERSIGPDQAIAFRGAIPRVMTREKERRRGIYRPPHRSIRPTIVTLLLVVASNTRHPDTPTPEKQSPSSRKRSYFFAFLMSRACPHACMHALPSRLKKTIIQFKRLTLRARTPNQCRHCRQRSREQRRHRKRACFSLVLRCAQGLKIKQRGSGCQASKSTHAQRSNKDR